jgi:alpha-L-arabinofuranosidase
LLGKQGYTQWNPDLIYFSNTEITPTINYYVQQLFGENCADTYLPAEVSGAADCSSKPEIQLSCVRDSESGDVIFKLVHVGDSPMPLRVELSGAESMNGTADCTVLAGPLVAVNEFATREPLLPTTTKIEVGESFDYVAPANSLSVIRIAPR